MEGPTPVSALIHAATMVTAGVYMVARMHAVFCCAPGGACSSSRASARLTALDRRDHRPRAERHQEGAGVLDGVAARLHVRLRAGPACSRPAMFHSMTHAFFKALLFLGAGAVIIALHHEQDLREMGGLARRCRSPSRRCACRRARPRGRAAVAGFFSKDEMLGRHRVDGAAVDAAHGAVLHRAARRRLDGVLHDEACRDGVLREGR